MLQNPRITSFTSSSNGNGQLIKLSSYTPINFRPMVVYLPYLYIISNVSEHSCMWNSLSGGTATNQGNDKISSTHSQNTHLLQTLTSVSFAISAQTKRSITVRVHNIYVTHGKHGPPVHTHNTPTIHLNVQS